MKMADTPLPHWTWEDLEAALDVFSPPGAHDPVRAHLLRGLAEDARRVTPQELLQQVLSAGWVMAQMGAREGGSAIDPRPAVPASGS